MKHVLCALREPNEVLLNHIYEFGRQHGWSVECCGEKIPRRWFGDGVLSDYLTQKELSVIDRFEQTPVVSRILLPRRNIRTVRPDTERIASMIADYFIDKGFTRFVTTPPSVPASMLDGKPRHIQTALKLALAERNFALIQLKFAFDSELQKDYRRGWERLRNFFGSIERPFALILPSPRRLALVYRVLDDLGVRVPEEVAVMVNTDNPMITENAAVPTSCISGEFGELASKMVELLERMMAGEPVPERMVYSSSAGVISRRSTDTLAVADLRLARAVSFFLQNYMNLIGVEDAAGMAGVSRGMLIRLFRNHFGKSPSRFLLEIRLNQIRHLLDSTDLTLAEIARRCGYGSDMALSLAFRRETGIPPGEYRNSRRHMEP